MNEDVIRAWQVAQRAADAAEALEAQDGGGTVNVTNVSNPPTDAQLDAAFGTVPAGFIGLLDDNNANTNVWLIGWNGTSWWYEALTKAV